MLLASIEALTDSIRKELAKAEPSTRRCSITSVRGSKV